MELGEKGLQFPGRIALRVFLLGELEDFGFGERICKGMLICHCSMSTTVWEGNCGRVFRLCRIDIAERFCLRNIRKRGMAERRCQRCQLLFQRCNLVVGFCPRPCEHNVETAGLGTALPLQRQIRSLYGSALRSTFERAEDPGKLVMTAMSELIV